MGNIEKAYNIYCDESRVENRDAARMVIGALIIPREKKKELARRAKKMHFIKAVLLEEVKVEIMHEIDRGTVAVFCVDLDCVMYLRNRVGTGKLQIGSFFDFGRDHTKMYEKQKRKCVLITDAELRGLVK